MDDNTVRVAVGLRLGSALCRPHTYHHCGVKVHKLATMDTVDDGRHYRHADVNNIIYRALAAAHVPSMLEPSEIYRSDGKCSNGISMVPWKRGKLLVWHTTCPYTYDAQSNVASSTSEARLIAPSAGECKWVSPATSHNNHFFTPVAIENPGGPTDVMFSEGTRLQTQDRLQVRKKSHLLGSEAFGGLPKRKLSHSFKTIGHENWTIFSFVKIV